jgi:hypothetical protein
VNEKCLTFVAPSGWRHILGARAHSRVGRVEEVSKLRPIRTVCVAALAALLSATVAWAAVSHAVAGGHYVGATNQQQHTTLVVSSTGRVITRLRTLVGYDGACGTRAPGPAFSVAAKHVRIAADGSFKATARGRAAHVASLHVTVTGSFLGKHVSGTVAEINGRCAAPNQALNPYSATFTLVAR